MKKIHQLFLISLALLISSNCAAHSLIGGHNTFQGGFLHPLSGIDHILMMFGFGLLAVKRREYTFLFLGMSGIAMFLGASLPATGLPISFIEMTFLSALFLLGVIFTLAIDVGLFPLIIFMGLASFLHGHVHATDLLPQVISLSYIRGFCLASLMLQTAGILSHKIFHDRYDLVFNRLLGTSMIIVAGYALL